MLPLDDSGAVGQPSFIKRYDIIATVLDLIQAAWIQVCQKPEINTKSDEETIAGALHNEMWVEKERRGINGPPIIDNEAATRRSDKSFKPDGFIDFKMIYSWDREDYFGIECKRVSSTKPDRNLATKYVLEGVKRFVVGTYSIGHDYAAMLGFVIDGKVPECIDLICDRLNKYKGDIRLKEDWIDEPGFGKTPNLYRTRHLQYGQKDLMTILHLFLIVN
ncbi:MULTISPECIES: hypothetical protein [unclassified Tolypothrix]|uniref:hypothetical protein n=1 Tax=unclassified Tolypothrix TaxID=2649714 RepID=UPI0005EAB628|nr:MULTISPECIES: hypothetical protein [unclassified Tolypothrix]BAY89816.1 hypothetical protein NIES3275_18190 [Microchaete diplosiphon NIES-3275]EKF00753.1 hypothetical protein FDUTEX481_08564 [Tolypothrix sp. PCC 7601]MBE9082918.1 hypothetical protein [Tolypothrix sp. LEGE 11397]UYD24070.1 hypothetical protein HGR01_21510 [Tolypothrix sp. PCC 7712]UYD33700.1 hypothetical protein HG267_33220 [Tolypothrix sp. PCC 7601]